MVIGWKKEIRWMQWKRLGTKGDGMALCSFAEQDRIVLENGSTFNGRTYTGGPFKIVHHTTEGSTYVGARETYVVTGSIPHFTVNSRNIFQHLDTSRSATALRNEAGGAQTNRNSAVQIEVVGRAALPKSRGTLRNVARLCRWIEETHQVSKEWPGGFPKPLGSVHDRDANTWNERSGHYGHCHVPENDHEDPGYTKKEVDSVMGQAPVQVFVGGNRVAAANGFLQETTVWTAVRALINAMDGDVNPGADQITVIVSFRGQTITIRARGVASGTAIVPVRELRRLNGVLVDYTPGTTPRVDISLPTV